MQRYNPSDFIVSKVGYYYETDLPLGFSTIICPDCGKSILVLVVPPNIFYSEYIMDDPRFPGELSLLCPNCNSMVRIRTGDEDENPFIEDNMLIESIEDWE